MASRRCVSMRSRSMLLRFFQLRSAEGRSARDGLPSHNTRRNVHHEQVAQAGIRKPDDGVDEIVLAQVRDAEEQKSDVNKGQIRRPAKLPTQEQEKEQRVGSVL